MEDARLEKIEGELLLDSESKKWVFRINIQIIFKMDKPVFLSKKQREELKKQEDDMLQSQE